MVFWLAPEPIFKVTSLSDVMLVPIETPPPIQWKPSNWTFRTLQTPEVPVTSIILSLR